MQKENEVIKIQVILNLIQDLQRLPLQLVNNMRGRSRIKYGMTALYTNSAFTLIELLVVVLIIGILAAVALPQYNKAVWKSRLTKVVIFQANALKALEAWRLEHGKGTEEIYFIGKNPDASLDIDLTNGLACDKEDSACYDDYFTYQVYSDGNGTNDYYGSTVTVFKGGIYFRLEIDGGKKTSNCFHSNAGDFGPMICEIYKSLVPDTDITDLN